MKVRARNRPVAIALATLAAGCTASLAGCGAPLTADELRERAAEICGDARERFTELQRTAPRTASEAEIMLEALVEVAEEEGRELASLRPPEELEDAYDDYLEAREEGIDLLREGAEAAAEHDAGAYERARRELDRGQRERLALAREARLRECATSIDVP